MVSLCIHNVIMGLCFKYKDLL